MLKTYPDNLKGAIILLFASLIWGSTFVPQKIAMDFWSPLQFTAIRFLIGAFLNFLIGLYLKYISFSFSKAINVLEPGIFHPMICNEINNRISL